jgi:hypothetical protein
VICLTCSSCLGLAQFSRSFAEIWNHQFLYWFPFLIVGNL